MSLVRWLEYYKTAVRKMLGRDVELYLQDGKIIAVSKAGSTPISLESLPHREQSVRAYEIKVIKCVDELIERLEEPWKSLMFYFYIDHSWHTTIDRFDPYKRYSTRTITDILRSLGLDPRQARRYWSKAMVEAMKLLDEIPDCIQLQRS